MLDAEGRPVLTDVGLRCLTDPSATPESDLQALAELAVAAGGDPSLFKASLFKGDAQQTADRVLRLAIPAPIAFLGATAIPAALAPPDDGFEGPNIRTPTSRPPASTSPAVDDPASAGDTNFLDGASSAGDSEVDLGASFGAGDDLASDDVPPGASGSSSATGDSAEGADSSGSSGVGAGGTRGGAGVLNGNRQGVRRKRPEDGSSERSREAPGASGSEVDTEAGGAAGSAGGTSDKGAAAPARPGAGGARRGSKNAVNRLGKGRSGTRQGRGRTVTPRTSGPRNRFIDGVVGALRTKGERGVSPAWRPFGGPAAEGSVRAFGGVAGYEPSLATPGSTVMGGAGGRLRLQGLGGTRLGEEAESPAGLDVGDGDRAAAAAPVPQVDAAGWLAQRQPVGRPQVGTLSRGRGARDWRGQRRSTRRRGRAGRRKSKRPWQWWGVRLRLSERLRGRAPAYGVLAAVGAAAMVVLVLGLVAVGVLGGGASTAASTGDAESPGTATSVASGRATSGAGTPDPSGSLPTATAVSTPPGTDWPTPWLDVLRALDRKRSTVFRTGDVSGLDAIYVPGSVPWKADKDLLASYRTQRLRIEGLTMEIRSLVIESELTDRAILQVVDRLVSGAAVDPAGRRTTFPRGRPVARRIVLQADAPGAWRIAEVTAL